MKKALALLIALLILGGCQLIEDPAENDNTNKFTDKEFNIADYDLPASQEMPDWYAMWAKAYTDFSLVDFSKVETKTIEYYSEQEYTERSAKNVPVVIESPDYHKLITIYYGQEPDSGVGIVIKDDKLQKFITGLHCGTPCIFLDGFWLDNQRFIVAGQGEVYPQGYEKVLETGVYYYAPYLYLVDLQNNSMQRYEAGPVLDEVYYQLNNEASLFRKFYIDNANDWQQLKQEFLQDPYFASFRNEEFSKTIDDIRLHDVNGDLYLDILIFNDMASTDRLDFYDSVVSDEQHKQFKKGPIIPDNISYVYGTNTVSYSDQLAGWQTSYEWLGSNLILTESQTNQIQDPNKTDWSVDYILNDGVNSIPDDMRCIVAFEFSGEKLKVKDGNEGNTFERLENPDGKFTGFAIEPFKNGYDLYYDRGQGLETFTSAYYKVEPDCQVQKINP